MPTQKPIRVLVWDEKPSHAPKSVYPESINGAIARGLNDMGEGQIKAVTANIEELEQGVSENTLSQTDVLLWWGHARHGEVHESTASRVYHAVYDRGMGFIALHSAHYSKPFQWVVKCSGNLGGWRETTPADTEELTVCAPRHPIVQGVDDFVLDEEEMYASPFDVPPPHTVVLQSFFPLGGEYFPSGICWELGNGNNSPAGRAFYFRPGHETYPTYFDSNVKQILKNAVLWSAKRI